MPGAIIALDQDRPGPSVSAGSPGVSRNDLWVNRVIRPRCTTSGNTTFAWTLLDKPAGSAAVISASDQIACALTADLVGSYRIKLVTNGGGPANVTIMTFRVRYDTSGVIASRGWAIPALGEVPSEDNFPVGLGNNGRGWSDTLEFMFADILAFMQTPPVVATASLNDDGRAARFVAYPDVSLDYTTNETELSVGGYNGTSGGNFPTVLDTSPSAAKENRICVLGNKVYVSGSVGGVLGHLVAYATASGTALGDFLISSGTVANSLCGIRDYYFDTILYVSDTVVQSILVSPAAAPTKQFSTSNNFLYTGGTWTNGRGVFVRGDLISLDPVGEGAGVWTDPTNDKIWAAEFYGSDAAPVLAYTATAGDAPTAICIDHDSEAVWVACTGNGGKIQKFTLNLSTRTLTKTLDVALANIEDILFDGSYLWCLSTIDQKLYKRNADGTANSVLDLTKDNGASVTAGRARFAFNGEFVLISGYSGTLLINPGTGRVAGRVGVYGSISVDRSGDGYCLYNRSVARFTTKSSHKVNFGQEHYSIRSGTSLDSRGFYPTFGFMVFEYTGYTTANDFWLPNQEVHPGMRVIIKDKDGTASANPLTVHGNSTIDGAATYVLNVNYGTVELMYDGTGWATLRKSLVSSSVATDLSLTGQAQGDIVYFNGTNWVVLAPGTAGQILQTNGAAANPTWVTDTDALPTDLNIAGETKGDVLYYNGTNWVRLGAGTAGQFLETNGAGANPSWATPSASPVRLTPQSTYGNVIHEWLLNDAINSATAADTGTGTATAMTVGATVAATLGGVGPLGACPYFTGVSAAANAITCTVPADMPTTNWSASVWFVLDKITSGMVLFGSTTVGVNNVIIRISGTQPEAYVGNTGGAIDLTPPAGQFIISPGVPNLIYVTYDISTVRLYLNDQQVASAPSTGTTKWTYTSSGNPELFIGADPINNPTAAVGKIQVCRIESAVRTLAQIQAIYKKGMVY